MRQASAILALQIDQGAVELLPSAIHTPSAEVVIDAFGMGIAGGQVHPLTASSYPIEDRIDNLPQVQAHGSPHSSPLSWQDALQIAPLIITEITCIDGCGMRYFARFPSASFGHLAMPIVSDGNFQMRSRIKTGKIYLRWQFCPSLFTRGRR